MVLHRRFLIVAATLFFAPFVVAQESPAQKPDTTSKLSAPAAVEPEYKIGPQDVLQIDVWKEPEISRTIPVRRCCTMSRRLA
jgi:protein involved in polysaccharide export with SLBB domain